MSAAGAMTIEEARALCASLPIPKSGDEPVFAAPWEARAFAMVVHLHKLGLFEWKEWADHLAHEIGEARDAGAIETPYYELWLRACEELLAEKALVAPEALRERCRALAEAAARDHDHPPHAPAAP